MKWGRPGPFEIIECEAFLPVGGAVSYFAGSSFNGSTSTGLLPPSSSTEPPVPASIETHAPDMLGFGHYRNHNSGAVTSYQVGSVLLNPSPAANRPGLGASQATSPQHSTEPLRICRKAEQQDPSHQAASHQAASHQAASHQAVDSEGEVTCGRHAESGQSASSTIHETTIVSAMVSAMVSAKASPSSAALAPVEAPRRRFDCSNYCTCLDLAAALNWDNFTCRGCSGDIDEALLWRARQALRKDDIARQVCDLPAIEVSDKAPTCKGAAANLNESVSAQAANRQAAEIHAAEIHAAEIHGAGVHEAGVFESTGKIANPAGGACKINAKNLTLAPKR